MKLIRYPDKPCSGQTVSAAPVIINTVILFWLTLFLCVPVTVYCKDLSALDIMEQVEKKEQEKTMSATTVMVLIGNNGQRRNREMQAYTKHENGLIKKSIFFISPSDVKGSALLTYDYLSKEQEDEQWVYLPALHRIKRISAGNRSGSFMGSDFSYGDLTQKSVNLYSYNLLKEQQIEEHAVWVIEAIPKDDETKKLYGYIKSLLLVRQDNFVIIRAVHWLSKNSLKYSEVRDMAQYDGVWVPLEVHAKTVTNGKTVHQTIIINKDVKINQPIDDDLFAKRRLEQGL